MLLIERDALFRTAQQALHQTDSSESAVRKQSSGPLDLESLGLRGSSFEDDCVSLASSVVSSEASFDRRVSFAEPLVTEIHTREYTPKEEVANLFYSCEETTRFRQEYRLERKLLAELDMDASSHREELSGLFESSRDPTECRHDISRVVVLHNDKIETFGPSQDQDVNNFFDNDSFWSGSITWY